MGRRIKSILAVVCGNFLYALTVCVFLLPSELVTGGTTGIAMMANHIWNISVSDFVLAFNVVMLIVGFVTIGKGFALTTLASTFLYPLFLKLCTWLIGDFVLTKDILLCTIFAGLGIGILLGIVIRSGASTGGMDIPPLVLNKFFRVPVSVGMCAFDFCILLMQAHFRPYENVLYGVVLVIIYTVVLDKVLLFGNSKTELKTSAKSIKKSAILY